MCLVNSRSLTEPALGIEQGDRVALILPNLPVYPIAHFAIARIGAIVVPTGFQRKECLSS